MLGGGITGNCDGCLSDLGKSRGGELGRFLLVR